MKKIFTWKNITGIITVLTFSFLIYDRWYKVDKVDKIKTEISAIITEIENTSNPNLVANNSDSTLIKEYQNTARDLCTLWSSIEKSDNFSKFSKMSEKDIVDILKSEHYRRLKYKDISTKMMEVLFSLNNSNIINRQHQGKDIVLWDYSKLLEIKELQDKKIQIEQDYLEKSIKYIQARDTKHLLNELDKLKSNAEYYLMDKALFEFIYDTNKLINMYCVQN